MVDKSGDETGYPAQQSKPAYIQEHLTDIIEGVNIGGTPEKEQLRSSAMWVILFLQTEKGKKSLLSFVAATE